MGITGFEGVGPEWLQSHWESSRLHFFWRKVRFLKGERGKPIYWCMLFRTNSLLSFFVFFPFLSVFILIFFLFLLLCFSFHLVKNPLFFYPLYRARPGPLYSACRDQYFTILPLNRLCLAWVYLPTMLCDTEPLPDRGGLILSFCAPRTHFVLLCAVAFPAMMLISSLLTLRACTQRFPFKLPLLGGLSSQQDVPPKRGLSRDRKQIFSLLPTTKPHPLYLLPLAHGPTMSCIGWVQAGGAWALRMLPS